MSGFVWLASYPKSGNTWLRMLISNLATEGDAAADINNPAERTLIASARLPFEEVTLIESEMLTADETDILRPRVFEAIARGDYVPPSTQPWRLRADWPPIVKAHDAYTLTPDGEPLMAAAQGAILIVRDPRAVAPSFANHVGCSLDRAIDIMASEDATFGVLTGRPSLQIRQKLLSWHAHAQSWLEQRDVPVHLVRYEDLKADTARVFREAMRFAGRNVSLEAAERAARLADFKVLRAQERAAGFVEWPSRRGFHTFFRRGEASGWRDELSQAQIARLEANHAGMMARLGYSAGRTEQVGQSA
jgi:aryl sulfotransferase